MSRVTEFKKNMIFDNITNPNYGSLCVVLKHLPDELRVDYLIPLKYTGGKIMMIAGIVVFDRHHKNNESVGCVEYQLSGEKIKKNEKNKLMKHIETQLIKENIEKNKRNKLIEHIEQQLIGEKTDEKQMEYIEYQERLDNYKENPL